MPSQPIYILVFQIVMTTQKRICCHFYKVPSHELSNLRRPCEITAFFFSWAEILAPIDALKLALRICDLGLEISSLVSK